MISLRAVAGLLLLLSVFAIFPQKVFAVESVGPHIMVGISGTVLSERERAFLRTNEIGGVILFSKNISGETQLHKLTSELSSALSFPQLIAVDQEGFPVARITFEPTWWLGQRLLFSTNHAYDLARRRAIALRGLGITMNLAPLVDVVKSPRAGMFIRSFRSDWGAYGDAMVRGHLAGGVFPVVKHFPSYGETTGDVEAKIISKDFSDEERQTFLQALQNSPFLMVSPVIIPSIDPELPAPVSPRVISYIRNDLGYRGVLLTDDVYMRAIMRNYDPEAFALSALRAGVDIVMLSTVGGAEDIVESIDRAAQKDPYFFAALEVSRLRMRKSLRYF